MYANDGYLNQRPRSVASDLGLHCLPMSHKKDAMLIWVKYQHIKNAFQQMPKSHTADQPMAPFGKDKKKTLTATRHLEEN